MAKFNQPIVSEEFYEENIAGFEVLYANIQSGPHIQVCLKEMKDEFDDGLKAIEDYESRIVTCSDIVPSEEKYHVSFWDEIAYFYSLIHPSEKKGITLTDDFFVSEKGAGITEIIPMDDQDDYTRIGTSLKMLGEHVYAGGDLRKLFKRVGIGEWEDVTDPAKHPNLYKDIDFINQRDGSYLNVNSGFADFDGFSEQDIYAAGDKDVWRFDGSRWHRVELPDYPREIRSVVCAEDGYVYIVGQGGTLAKGREETWEIFDIPFLEYKKAAWFNDTLWLASDYELGVFKDGEYKRYEFPKGGDAQYSFGGVCACPELLMAYGPAQVLVYDGEAWKEIIGPALY